MIGKFVKAALRSPTLYLALVWALIAFVLWPLADNPGSLYGYLSPKLYDRWEDFTAFGFEYWIRLLCFAGIATSATLAVRAFLRPHSWIKIGSFPVYLFLLFAFLLVFLPGTGRAREKAKRINCFSNMKAICMTIGQYAKDYEGFMPPDLQTLKKTDYLAYEEVYRCPSRSRPNPEFSDYLYYGAGRRSDEKSPYPLLEDRPGNHPRGYRNVIFSDGTIKPIDAESSEK
ncbi:MAG: hypothetical protein AB7F32_06820 [Victivallaceae bacterium]